jgi:aminoglycoside 6'-N-acetyltransferase
MELRGRDVILRPVEPGDAPILAEILAEPAVARWWGTFDLERVRRDLTVESPDEEGFAIELDGAVIGYIQAVEENEPDFRHASIDLFVRTAAQGRGLGPDAIRILAAHLIDERGHHRITIDPAVANGQAIAAYERVGFRPVGVMREYQRMADGTWVDALLMDLLSTELVR